MGIFNFGFFGTPEHRVVNYKPRYCGREKEALKQKSGPLEDKKNKNYVPGSHIKGSFRGGNYQRTRKAGRASGIIGMISLILAFVVIYLIAKYYPLLLSSMK